MSVDFRTRIDPEQQAVEAGVFAYLVKPVSKKHLLPAISLASARYHEYENLKEETDGLREALTWARESGVPSFAVLAQVYLARRPDGDRLAARVALEQHADRLTAAERTEAHFALWEADGEHASLDAAWRELRRLALGAPTIDREAMQGRVDLFHRVASAWAAQTPEHA